MCSGLYAQLNAGYLREIRNREEEEKREQTKGGSQPVAPGPRSLRLFKKCQHRGKVLVLRQHTERRNNESQVGEKEREKAQVMIK